MIRIWMLAIWMSQMVNDIIRVALTNAVWQELEPNPILGKVWSNSLESIPAPEVHSTYNVCTLCYDIVNVLR